MQANFFKTITGIINDGTGTSILYFLLLLISWTCIRIPKANPDPGYGQKINVDPQLCQIQIRLQEMFSNNKNKGPCTYTSHCSRQFINHGQIYLPIQYKCSTIVFFFNFLLCSAAVAGCRCIFSDLTKYLLTHFDDILLSDK